MLWLLDAALEDPPCCAPASFLTLSTLHKHSSDHAPLLFNNHKRFYKAHWLSCHALALNHLYSCHRCQLNLNLPKLARCCPASEPWHMACPLSGGPHRPLSHCGEPRPTGLRLSANITPFPGAHAPPAPRPLSPWILGNAAGLLSWGWKGPESSKSSHTPPRSVILIFRMHQIP